MSIQKKKTLIGIFYVTVNNSAKAETETEPEIELWATPRASWRTTDDGYIEQVDIDKALKHEQERVANEMVPELGYSKIKRITKNDTVLTAFKPQITLSYKVIRSLRFSMRMKSLPSSIINYYKVEAYKSIPN